MKLLQLQNVLALTIVGALACDSDHGGDVGNGAGAGNGADAGDAGQDPTHLVEIDAQDVTPTGRTGFRPDVVVIRGSLYLAYNDVAGREYRLLRLGEDLQPLNSVTSLFSARAPADHPTDIRVASGANDTFWYGLETVAQPLTNDTCDKRYLNAAIYDTSGATPSPIATEMDLVFGCPPPSSTPSGDYRIPPHR